MKENNSPVFDIFYNAYLFLKRYLIIVIIFLILGIGTGVYKYYTKTYTFKKEVLIFSEDISYVLLKQFSLALINDLYTGQQQLAASLGVDPETASKITGIQTDSVTVRGKIFTLTTIKLNDTAGTGNIAEKYVNYLSSSPYIEKLINENSKHDSLILEKINQKIEEMDDNKIISSGNYMPHAEYIELYAKKIDYEDKIKNKSGIDLIREDTLLMSSGTGLAASCFIYGFVFLVLSVITGLFIDVIRKIIRMEKKKSQAG